MAVNVYGNKLILKHGQTFFMGTMAYDICHVVKPDFSVFNANGGFYVRIGYNVRFQHLGGYAGGRCKREALQKL